LAVHWIYRISNPAVRMMLFLLSRWEVKGKENVPREGPLIVVANHMTNIDPPLLSVSLGRYGVFMAKEGLFRSRLSNYFIRGLGAFPVYRDRMRRETLLAAEEVLKNNYALCIFPEGMRSRTGQLRQAFSGSALIALRTGVPILPAAITGTETVKGMNWLRRPRLTVTFGRPFHLPPPGGNKHRDKSAEYMMERIAELLPPEYRGVYSYIGTEQKA
jgi:1-acyl-sn-glycerol-3-phosphate acyltransferase